MNTGDFLGRYRVVRKIGEGGMGEVFLAEDPKLNRQIAVKVLSADFAADHDRMARFVHEAISASALNHPNIITIHEINDDHDPPFIAMEHVEGETLGRRMREHPLEIHETLDIAIQVATALAAAHDANVVHRDVKPDNVILRPDGLVKVLDFGLAKQVDRGTPASVYDAATVPNIKTHPGLVMGTVAYMSPEQARGKLVDSRSDIFSFGSMLYQMTSGRLPFIGENDLDVVGSILHKEPRPLSQSARIVPHDVDLLIKKALRKNREERYQSMREIVADLKDIREELRVASNGYLRSEKSSGSLSEAERGMPTEKMHAARIHSTRELSFPPSTLSGILISQFKTHPIRSAGFSVVLMLFIAAVSFGIYKMSDGWGRNVTFEAMRFEKLTFSGDVAAEQVSISPDGKYFAYVTSAAGEQTLWVKQTGAESNLQVIGPSGNQYNGITFSPDGNRIYYSVKEKEGAQSIYQIPALGGPSRKIAENAVGPVAFSPDGRRIAYIKEGNTALMISNIDGSEESLVAKAKDDNRWLNVAFSPDGTRLATIYFSAADAVNRISEVNLADGAETIIEPPMWHRLRGIHWLRDGTLLVSGRDPETQLAQIWIVDPQSGTRTRVTNDIQTYQGVSVTGDERFFVTTQWAMTSAVWIAGSFSDRPVKITKEIGKYDGMSGVSFMPDGRILFTTRVKADQDIWIMNGDGSGVKQLTSNSRANYSPVTTPDGRFIVFASTRGGNPSLWRMDPDGGNVVQLTNDPGGETDPAISADGKWVVFQYTDRSNVETIKKVSLDGGEISAVSTVEAINPTLSPDGAYVVCKYDPRRTGQTQVAILPVAGGDPIKVFNSPAMARSRNIRFSPDGRSLIYVDARQKVDNLWAQPIDGGPPEQMTEFSEDRIFRFDVSYPSGKFVFARGTDTSDVLLIRNFR